MLPARLTKGKLLENVNLDRPFSNFSFVDEYFGGLTALRRIFSQVRRLGCHTLLIEEIDGGDDILQENKDLENHPDVGKLRFAKTFRLSFFTIPYKGGLRENDLQDDDFQGYAIVRIVHSESGWVNAWVYESVIKPERTINNFMRRAPIWQCCVMGNTFKVKGYLYAQQNGKTNCCAHVAVRTAAASFSDKGDLFYHEMNEIIGGYKGNGLTSDEMIQILEQTGASCFVGSFEVTQTGDFSSRIPFQKYIYGSIESGYPAIIFFGVCGHGDFHAIPAIGHTFNQDNWVPRAEQAYFKIGRKIRYIPSESWLSMFICHDDNFGSNYCIPRHYLHSGNEISCKNCKKEDNKTSHHACVCYVIGTLPNHIKINPIEAEAIGADYLFELKESIPNTDNQWVIRLKHSAAYNKLVLRPILLTASEYTTHISKIRGWTYQKIDESIIDGLTDDLANDWFWLIEISISELFAANKRKLGEVLIRATAEYRPGRRFDSFVLTRLPGYFVLYNEDTKNFVFIPSKLDDHVELFGQEEGGS